MAASRKATPSSRAVGPTILSTNPTSTFTNAGADGISRLVTVGDRLFVNNIARNYELVTPGTDPTTGRPTLQRDAYHDVTSFPGEDIPSQLDLDAHGVFERPDLGVLLVYDHHGRIRCFLNPPDRHGPLTQVAQYRMLGDTERVVMAGRCFITSSPRGQYSSDAPQPGIFVSEPVPGDLQGAGGALEPLPLAYRQELADWGTVTALAVAPSHDLLAVGTAGHLGLFALDRLSDGVRLGRCLWEADTPYHAQWLAVDAAHGRVLAGGYDLSANDEHGDGWDACRGGGICAFSLRGEPSAPLPLPAGTAWGYAANPLALSIDGLRVHAVDRSTGLHEVDLTLGLVRRLSSDQGDVKGQSQASLGIGHLAIMGRTLYAAYTRGGFSLYRFALT